MPDDKPTPSGIEDEEVCGWSYYHDTEIVYDEPDGTQWVCRRCGAEGWEEPDAE